jgi:hypothetical protein
MFAVKFFEGELRLIADCCAARAAERRKAATSITHGVATREEIEKMPRAA